MSQEQVLHEARVAKANTFLFANDTSCFLSRTELPSGRIGMTVDPGSVWDLAGEQCAKSALAEG